MEFRKEFHILEDDVIRLKIREKVEGNARELPFYYYGIYLKSLNKETGKISIRIGHNKHSYYNGNIGYEIYPNTAKIPPSLQAGNERRPGARDDLFYHLRGRKHRLQENHQSPRSTWKRRFLPRIMFITKRACPPRIYKVNL